MLFAGERSVEAFQAGVLFIDCKAVPAVEIQGGFPVGTGFQGDLVAMEFPGDIRGFPEERGSIPPVPVIGMGDNVLNDREGADIVGQAPEGFRVRFLRLSDMSVPYGRQPCISGLRVFGLEHGEKPAVPVFTARRDSDLDMTVSIQPQDHTLGYNILFGNSPEKLYHSYMVFQTGEKRVGALIKGRDYFVRVDAFNESGITEGTCIQL